MSVPAAYLGIVLIWATTPLAIKWSGEDGGFLLGVALRMTIGYIACLMLLWLGRVEFPWNAEARRSYLIAGMGMFSSMLGVYWGAQYVPSGLISVIYGLSPILIGVFAFYWLEERNITVGKVFGILLSLSGLGVIFLPHDNVEAIAPQGVIAVLASVTIHSLSAVWIKRLGAQLHPLAVNGGSLTVAVPLYLLLWLLFDGSMPQQLSERSLWAIVYLAVLGTVVGFNLYFYVLKRVSAAAVGLVTLITPVLALFLGQGLNGESIEPQVWLGTAAILSGLVIYQLGGRLLRLMRIAA